MSQISPYNTFRLIFVTVLLLVSLAFSSHSFAQITSNAATETNTLKTLNFGFLIGLDELFTTTRSHAMLNQALKELGYEFNLVELPAKRSLANTSMGILDGDLSRAPHLTEGVTNLVQVPTPFISACYAGFSLGEKESSKPVINADWKETAAPVGVLFSVVSMREKAATIWPEKDIIYLKDTSQGVKMLNSGRIKTAILPTTLQQAISNLITDVRVSNTNLTQTTPILLNIPTYTYLNQKHQQLAIDLAKKIDQLRPSYNFVNSCEL
jgi:hypothetical protein